MGKSVQQEEKNTGRGQALPMIDKPIITHLLR